ncbi:hypothetical protein H109_06280 [Trichophyton interdigitale MR816]|uniref:CFEM domain-containing protein n=1 Tax=Trichophyton interdigitale (strain MR816) TaxID=1215338 RepID=A0A059J1U5_TRIIM|nr:hypothetical protein H101_01644 [Trichophyton interdigitale H6]KDB21820.1 hypothetical protein H109_06280 [Trichophyton interdigitale MR816]
MPGYPAVPVANSLLTFLSAASAAAATITSIITTTRSSSLSSSSPSAFSNLGQNLELDLDRKYKQVQARNQTPKLLSKNVPACALPCLESFISSEKPWDGCPEPLDVNCLCKSRSTTGYTVAEAGLRCVAENCPDSEVEQHAVYAMCSGVEAALPNTHPVIGISSTAAPKPSSMTSQPPTMTSAAPKEPAPAPPNPTPPTPVPAPPPPVSDTMMSMMATSTQMSLPQITTLPMTSVIRSGIPGVGIPTDTIDFTFVYSSETGSASATGEPGAGGHSNQLVGLYVGGGIAMAALITIVLFFIFLSRRRRRAKQGQESEKGQQGRYRNIDRAMSDSRTTPALSLSNSSSNHRSISSRPRTLLPIDMMPCSVAYLHRSTRDLENEYASSRGHSAASQRTQSDLLPDNPHNGSSAGSRSAERERVHSPFGDACSSRGPSPKSISQSVVDPLRSASSLNYSPALVQANQRSTQSPHSFNSGFGYATNSPNRSQSLSPDSRFLAVPSKVHAAQGRSPTNTRDQFQPSMTSHLAPPSYTPEPFSSRSIHSYISHIPRQLSPVREVPSTGPPSSAGTPDIPQPAYHRSGHLSAYAESDDASEMSVRTYSKLVPPPLSTHKSVPDNYVPEALPDHSPTLPKAMLAGSVSSCCSTPRSSIEHNPNNLRHQTSTASSKKPSSLLVKRRGEKVADKMGNEITLPAIVQRPIEIEHDQIHEDDDNNSIRSSSLLSRSSSNALSRSNTLPHRMHNNTAASTATSSKGYNKVTPSKRGGDMYLSIE